MTKKSWQIVTPQVFVTTNNEYQISGRTYYRVTATLGVIAKHRLLSWKKRVGPAKAESILQTRQAIGVYVHKLIELTLKGEDYNLGAYETEIQEGLKKFYEFKKLAKLKAEGIEQRLWYNKYGYAGTADFIGHYTSPVEFLAAKIVNHKRIKTPLFSKGAFVIGDWKTGKNIYPSAWLQLAAYAEAFEHLTGVKLEGGFITRIRDGKLQVKEISRKDLHRLFPAYLHALGLYEWQYRIGKFAWLKG